MCMILLSFPNFNQYIDKQKLFLGYDQLKFHFKVQISKFLKLISKKLAPNMRMEVWVVFFTMKIDESLIFHVSMSNRMIMKKHILKIDLSYLQWKLINLWLQKGWPPTCAWRFVLLSLQWRLINLWYFM